MLLTIDNDDMIQEIEIDKVDGTSSDLSMKRNDIKTVSLGKVLSTRGYPSDPSEFRSPCNLAISNKLGLLFEINGSLVERTFMKDFENIAFEVEKVLLSGASSTAKIKDALTPRNNNYTYSCGISDQNVKGIRIASIANGIENALIVWFDSSIFCFEISSDEPPSFLWKFQLDSSNIVDTAVSSKVIGIISDELFIRLDINNGNCLTQSNGEEGTAPFLSICSQCGSDVWAIGTEDGNVVIVKAGEMILKMYSVSTDDPVEAHSLLWPNPNSLFIGMRGKGTDDNGDVGSLPCLAILHLDEELTATDTLLIEDPLAFNSADKPWEHRFFFQQVPNLDAVLVVSTWSRNLVLISRENSTSFEWKFLELKDPRDDNAVQAQVLDMSIFGIDERPWVLVKDEDDEDILECDALPIGAVVSLCNQRSIHPFHIFGESGELEDKAHFSPAPTLLIATTDGLIELVSLVDTSKCVPETYPGMVMPETTLKKKSITLATKTEILQNMTSADHSVSVTPSNFGSDSKNQGLSFSSDSKNQGTTFGSDSKTQGTTFGSDSKTQSSLFGSDSKTQSSLFGSDSKTQSSLFGGGGESKGLNIALGGDSKTNTSFSGGDSKGSSTNLDNVSKVENVTLSKSDSKSQDATLRSDPLVPSPSTPSSIIADKNTIEKAENTRSDLENKAISLKPINITTEVNQSASNFSLFESSKSKVEPSKQPQQSIPIEGDKQAHSTKNPTSIKNMEESTTREKEGVPVSEYLKLLQEHEELKQKYLDVTKNTPNPEIPAEIESSALIFTTPILQKPSKAAISKSAKDENFIGRAHLILEDIRNVFNIKHDDFRNLFRYPRPEDESEFDRALDNVYKHFSELRQKMSDSSERFGFFQKYDEQKSKLEKLKQMNYGMWDRVKTKRICEDRKMSTQAIDARYRQQCESKLGQTMDTLNFKVLEIGGTLEQMRERITRYPAKEMFDNRGNSKTINIDSCLDSLSTQMEEVEKAIRLSYATLSGLGARLEKMTNEEDVEASMVQSIVCEDETKPFPNSHLSRMHEMQEHDQLYKKLLEAAADSPQVVNLRGQRVNPPEDPAIEEKKESQRRNQKTLLKSNIRNSAKEYDSWFQSQQRKAQELVSVFDQVAKLDNDSLDQFASRLVNTKPARPEINVIHKNEASASWDIPDSSSSKNAHPDTSESRAETKSLARKKNDLGGVFPDTEKKSLSKSGPLKVETPFGQSDASASQTKAAFGETSNEFKFGHGNAMTFSDTKQEPPNLVPPDSFQASADHHRERLLAFYQKYNPKKVDSVDDILEKYKGREGELFEKLNRQYADKSANGVAVTTSPALNQGFGFGPSSGLQQSSGFPSAAASASSDGFGFSGFQNSMGNTNNQMGNSQFGVSSSQNTRERLVTFYTQHNPQQLGKVDDILKKYQGREDVLFQELEKRYAGKSAQNGASGGSSSAFGTSSSFGNSSSVSTSGFNSTSGFGQASTMGTQGSNGAGFSQFGTIGSQSAFGAPSAFGSSAHNSSVASSSTPPGGGFAPTSNTGGLGFASFSGQQPSLSQQGNSGFGSSSLGGFGGSSNTSGFGQSFNGGNTSQYSGSSFSQRRK